jgi:hypothetical protein
MGLTNALIARSNVPPTTGETAQYIFFISPGGNVRSVENWAAILTGRLWPNAAGRGQVQSTKFPERTTALRTPNAKQAAPEEGQPDDLLQAGCPCDGPVLSTGYPAFRTQNDVRRSWAQSGKDSGPTV